MAGRNYSRELLGLTLKDDWRVVEAVALNAYDTGSCFSVNYIVERQSERAFLKALDLSRAFLAENQTEVLEFLTVSFNYEKRLLMLCEAKRMDRVVRVIGEGSVQVDAGEPLSNVPYLVFELANGDIRGHVRRLVALDHTWVMRTLHQVAVGLSQLHGAGIAHQDLKPSNVMVFDGTGAKVGDLGRASRRGETAPHDDLSIAGDPHHAPPECQYGAEVGDWAQRRFACDLYHLGSMITFLFTGAGFNALLFDAIEPSLRPDVWDGTYDEVLPSLLEAHARTVNYVVAQIPDEMKDELRSTLLATTVPHPAQRGHPLSRAAKHGNQYELNRFISQFDRLAKRASRRARGLDP